MATSLTRGGLWWRYQLSSLYVFVLDKTLLVSADVSAPHDAAAGLTIYYSVYNSMMHVEAGLLRNEAVFTPHLVAAALEPLRLDHFYFGKEELLNFQQITFLLV